MINTIFLFGYMGAGKTVIGKSLSKSINYEFYDLDNFIAGTADLIYEAIKTSI